MDTQAIKNRMTTDDQPVSLIVDLMLSDFDDLVELDYIHARMRNLHHKEGKYYAPVIDASIRDIRRYCAEHMVHPDDRERYLEVSDPATVPERMKQLQATRSGVTRERFRYKLLAGGWRWVEQVIVAGEQNGMPDGVCYIFLFDVQDQMDREEQGGAAGDGICTVRSELTGLMVEEAFYSHARSILRGHTEGWCVISVDLEHFKLFNEWYGRKHGDMLLSQIGNRLRRMEEAVKGAACYFGQDDFALLMPYDADGIHALYADIHELIKEYGTSVGFMPAIGVCMTEKGVAVEELVDHASVAARYAKENYHTRIRMFEPAMYQQTERDYQILSDFQKALRDHELFIMLQPQCKISTKRVVGAESLVRWKKEDGTTVSPGIFVPVLEKYGFVTDLDKYVWEEVCAWQKKWIDGGHTALPISVNVSQIDIFTIDVPEFFSELLEKYSLPVDTVKIEITESAYVDNGAVADTVQRLREKGFLVLMDDFGSGYSSLNMLRNLNVDVIKLDAQFLRMNGDDTKGIHIMESIVNMAKTMGVPIIVEGVETKEEADFLAGLGCRYVQGYYFYRPMLVTDFEKLISDRSNIDTRGFRFKMKEQFNTRDFLDKNIFSDTMLNNILGPVGFFVWHGDDVDIARYNEQLAKEVGSPRFKDHHTAMQKALSPEDAERLYGLLERAMKDPLRGAAGEFSFRRKDGEPLVLELRFFYLEEDESGRHFYGSIRNVTQISRMSKLLRTLSHTSNDVVAFLTEENGKWSAQVAIHGLEKVLGLSADELERELNNGAFHERVHPEDRGWINRLMNESDMKLEAFSPPFRFRAADGGSVRLRLGLDNVKDKDCGVSYLMILRKIDD